MVRLGPWVALLACGCAKQTDVRLSIDAAPGLDVRALFLQVGFAGVDPDLARSVPGAGGKPTLPGQLDLILPNSDGPATLTLVADDALGRVLTASTQVQVAARAETSAAIFLGADVAPACRDGSKAGMETDVDCGGPCPPCAAGRACLVGGDCASGSCVAGACALASDPPRWQPAADMPTARLGLAAIVSPDGHLYAVGGSPDDTMALPTVEIYDPSADRWSTGPPLSTPRYRTAGALGPDGKLYVAGGKGQDSSCESLGAGDPAWTTLADLPTPRYSHAVASSGTRVFVIGGEESSASVTAVASYAPSQGAWGTAAPLADARTNLAAAVGPDGKVYVAGGHNAAQAVYYDLLDVYDPQLGQWASGTPMVARRSDLCAAFGPDGRFYAIGGYTGTSGLTIVEAYTPAHAAWAPVAALNDPRDAGAAATLADGRIVALGGRMPAAQPGTSSVEIYGPVIRLDPPSTAAGQTITVHASNFAGAALLRISIDGVLTAAGTTDASGTSELTVRTPAGTSAGGHAVQAVDDKSRYPVTAQLTISGS